MDTTEIETHRPGVIVANGKEYRLPPYGVYVGHRWLRTVTDIVLAWDHGPAPFEGFRKGRHPPRSGEMSLTMPAEHPPDIPLHHRQTDNELLRLYWTMDSVMLPNGYFFNVMLTDGDGTPCLTTPCGVWVSDGPSVAAGDIWTWSIRAGEWARA